jgi:flagellar biosynthetic protein FliO
VAAHKKKIVAFLVAVALGSGMLVICSAQSAPAERTKSLFDNSSSSFENEPNFSTASTNSLGTRELFFKMMLSVLLVVFLGAAVIYISKKFLPKLTNPSGKAIHIIETAHLGPRKAVHLLKVGNQQILVGSTSESITKLADITEVLKRDNENLVSTDSLSEMNLSAHETDNNLRI